MDPYLEQSEIWPSFHHRLADELADQLNPLIGPKYYADIEVRTVVEEVALGTRSTMVPDTAVFERRLSPGAPAPLAVATITAEPV